LQDELNGQNWWDDAADLASLTALQEAVRRASGERLRRAVTAATLGPALQWVIVLQTLLDKNLACPAARAPGRPGVAGLGPDTAPTTPRTRRAGVDPVQSRLAVRRPGMVLGGRRAVRDAPSPGRREHGRPGQLCRGCVVPDAPSRYTSSCRHRRGSGFRLSPWCSSSQMVGAWVLGHGLVSQEVGDLAGGGGLVEVDQTSGQGAGVDASVFVAGWTVKRAAMVLADGDRDGVQVAGELGCR
ncbi:MAG: hypothetical protein ACREQ5_38955, partial [Candidatus Dormibacteria bacterium]